MYTRQMNFFHRLFNYSWAVYLIIHGPYTFFVCSCGLKSDDMLIFETEKQYQLVRCKLYLPLMEEYTRHQLLNQLPRLMEVYSVQGRKHSNDVDRDVTQTNEIKDNVHYYSTATEFLTKVLPKGKGTRPLRNHLLINVWRRV